MQFNFKLLLLLCIIRTFEKGKVYVVEFWATWCKPCNAEMLHLSALATEYKGKVTILGINVYEDQTTSLAKLRAFVDSMGNKMDYDMAAQDSNMVTAWLNDSDGIPKSFVVNGEGRLAWIGHPRELDDVLHQIVNNTWNIKEALAKRNLEKHLEELDKEVYYEVVRYLDDPSKPDDFGQPDSILFVINEITRTEPRLKYAPSIAYHTFSSLLKTNPQKAYEYGKVVLVTSTYLEPACYAIIDPIKLYADRLNLPAEIYQLGAEAYQVRIRQISHPEQVNMSRIYNNMAEWYWRANDKVKAVKTQHKAIEALKSRKGISAPDLAEFESRLQQYKNMKEQDGGFLP